MNADELHALEQAVSYLHLPWRCGKNHWDCDAIYDANGCAVSERVSESDDTVTAVNALPALIAKVRAAEELATRVDRALYDFGDDYPGRLDPVSDALDAYRKAGQP